MRSKDKRKMLFEEEIYNDKYFQLFEETLDANILNNVSEEIKNLLIKFSKTTPNNRIKTIIKNHYTPITYFFDTKLQNIDYLSILCSDKYKKYIINFGEIHNKIHKSYILEWIQKCIEFEDKLIDIYVE